MSLTLTLALPREKGVGSLFFFSLSFFPLVHKILHSCKRGEFALFFLFAFYPRMSTHKSSIRRRGTGSTSLEGAAANGTGAGSNYPNYLPVFRETIEPRYDLESPPLPPADSPTRHHRRPSSFHSFLTDKSLEPVLNNGDESDEVEDVKTDVLYPRYKASKDDHVDIAAFNRMVQDRTRKMSTGTLQLSKTLSRQNQLYGSSKNFDIHPSGGPSGIRFKIYSSQKNSSISTSLDELLTERGQKALESVVESRGWWVDVLCPSVEEMRVLSKVSTDKHLIYINMVLKVFLDFSYTSSNDRRHSSPGTSWKGGAVSQLHLCLL